ncbi:MAG: nucleotidyl transferase AbiEii/AbiGii toxin family protein [Mucilaginibacter sp.]|uniref:nucleotidyl transferase AbiEii/AbiGii toxin family protein n=1 Tax=Mucilaginibacter sp. TaxID=1882438 RepID=UPI0034E5FF04
MKDSLLKDFFLVGGTALALQIGHRISIDLDFFNQSAFDENFLIAELESKYNFQLDYQSKNTLKGEMQGIKVDFITHNYPLVKPLIEEEELRMSSPEDIAAMKLNVIAGNGTRLKDFIDIAYLSSTITLSQMVNAYEFKYTSRNPSIVLKALTYHQDINFKEVIEMINNRYKWKNVEKRLFEMMKFPKKLFPEI